MTSSSNRGSMPRLDWLRAMEREAADPGGIGAAVDYQNALHEIGPELIEIALAARSVHMGFTCPNDPMDVDERLERLGAALERVA